MRPGAQGVPHIRDRVRDEVDPQFSGVGIAHVDPPVRVDRRRHEPAERPQQPRAEVTVAVGQKREDAELPAGTDTLQLQPRGNEVDEPFRRDHIIHIEHIGDVAHERGDRQQGGEVAHEAAVGERIEDLRQERSRIPPRCPAAMGRIRMGPAKHLLERQREPHLQKCEPHAVQSDRHGARQLRAVRQESRSREREEHRPDEERDPGEPAIPCARLCQTPGPTDGATGVEEVAPTAGEEQGGSLEQQVSRHIAGLRERNASGDPEDLSGLIDQDGGARDEHREHRGPPGDPRRTQQTDADEQIGQRCQLPGKPPQSPEPRMARHVAHADGVGCTPRHPREQQQGHREHGERVDEQ
jgi:hypothetical protein